MKITVCIPTFNRPLLLRRAVLSVLAQECDRLEILVGYDGDSVESKKALVDIRFNSNFEIQHLVNQPPLGQGENVHHLFSRASGEYILLLHDDDYLLPGALKLMASALDNDSSILACFGRQKVVTEAGVDVIGISERYDKILGRSKNLSPMHSAILGQFPNAGYLIRRTLLPTDAYRAASLYHCACDYAFGLIIAANASAKFLMLDDFTYAYGLTTSSLARSSKTSNSQAVAYLINKALVCDPRYSVASKKWLKLNSRVCIKAASEHGHSILAFQWFFGEYHRPHLFTLGAVKRLLMCFRSIFIEKTFSIPPNIFSVIKSPA